MTERQDGIYTTTFEQELQRHGQIVFTNRGTSMMPLLRENRDLMVIDRKGEARCRKYDAVLYRRENGAYVLHRVLRVRERDYVIVGDHCWQKEYGITDQHIIGVLSAVVRDGKTISVTDKRYLAYVHLWCDFFPIRALLLRGKAKLGALLRLCRSK